MVRLRWRKGGAGAFVGLVVVVATAAGMSGCVDQKEGPRSDASPTTAMSVERAAAAYTAIVREFYPSAVRINDRYFIGPGRTLAWEQAPFYCRDFAENSQHYLAALRAIAWPPSAQAEADALIAIEVEGIAAHRACADAPGTEEAQAGHATRRDERRERAALASAALREALGLTEEEL